MPDQDSETAGRAGDAYAARARYFDSSNAFNIKHAPVPRHQFTAERDRALDAATPTGLIHLDLGPRLGIPFPATTPLMLASYVRIRAGETLAGRTKASVEAYYGMRGAGVTRRGDDTVPWRAGDVFLLPGGGETVHEARDGDALLYRVTNEPLFALENAEPPAPGNETVDTVLYPAAEIRRRVEALYAREDWNKEIAGYAIQFSAARTEAIRNIAPSLTLAMNSLAPGDHQRAHRHNSAAITLCVQGAGCYSVIEGERIDWQADAVTITPPGEVHAHFNGGDALALFLIMQDGGLYYHACTMGFAFAE